MEKDYVNITMTSKEKEGRIFIITDTHLGHRNMVAYADRPIEFDDIILRNLSVLKPGDTLIHLGDFCMGKDEMWHIKWNAAITPGVKKILIKGNHDKKSNTWYLNHGWDEVCNSFSGHYFGLFITFSHIPIKGTQNLNIHGHMHANIHRMDEEMKAWYNFNLNKNFEIESNGYKPELLEDLIHRFTEKKYHEFSLTK